MTSGPSRLLEGKRTLVTGASSGLGAATARLFAEHGARVALLARNAQALDELARDLGETALCVAADVADDAQVAEAVRRADEAFGGLDIVVNSAGIDGPVPLEDLDPEIWRRQIDVNLSGTFYVAREAALRMRASGGGGSIVNIGSELSFLGMGLYVHYCASKAGVIGLTRALAAELAPDVKVNALCPGPMDTPMMDAELEWFPDPKVARDGAIERVPLKRFATAAEVAEAVLFLATGAPYATGAAISLDGGTTMV
jgi:3-oxoacyl-[acyl-carrier protein] reductase